MLCNRGGFYGIKNGVDLPDKLCPKCGEKLSTYDFCGITFDICKSCGSVIITNENFNKIVQKLDKSAQPVDVFSLSVVKCEEVARKCPQCEETMDKVLYNGVLIDRCNSCKMLLFDNGELAKYFRYVSKFPIEIVSNPMFIKMYCSNTNYEKYDEKEIEENKNTERKTFMQIQSKEKEKT